MRSFKGIRTAAAVIILAILTLVWLLSWKPWSSASDLLSTAEVQQIVLAEYPGEVLYMERREGEYVIRLQRDHGVYELLVRASDGYIIGIEQVESAGPQPPPEDVKEQPILEKKTVQEIVLKAVPGELHSIELIERNGIQEYEAIVQSEQQWIAVTVDAVEGSIISTSVIGEVEEPRTLITEEEARTIALEHIAGEIDDIDLEQSDAAAYYLVEVEREDGGEAVVQIDAISGKILSTTWDEDGEEEDDES